MSPDEQEALSRQHIGHWIVVLESGKIAVWSHPMRSDLRIIESLSELRVATVEGPNLNLDLLDL